MQVEKNKVVSLSYELRLKNAGGEVVETVTAGNPLTFIFGTGQLLHRFESNIDGLEVGQEFSFSLPCDEAYGPNNPDAVVDLPLQVFEVDGKIDESLLSVGRQIPMMDRDGNRLNGVVTEVHPDKVTMDFNHPLAGEDLFFSGSVVNIREASEEELAHGHVHQNQGCGDGCGCGGHGKHNHKADGDCGCEDKNCSC